MYVGAASELSAIFRGKPVFSYLDCSKIAALLQFFFFCMSVIVSVPFYLVVVCGSYLLLLPREGFVFVYMAFPR